MRGMRDSMRVKIWAESVPAPETKRVSEACGPPSDVWTIGVLMYWLLCGFPPFASEELSRLFESVQAADYDYPCEYWDDKSDSAIDLI